MSSASGLTNRKIEDADRFETVLSQVSGKRIMFKELIGWERDSPASWGLDSGAESAPDPNSWKRNAELLRPYPFEGEGEQVYASPNRTCGRTGSSLDRQ